jgi:hypothetical protein
MRGAVAADDRSGVAQPDIAKGFDHDLRGVADQQFCGGRGFLIGGDQDHLLAAAVGVHRLGKGGDFDACGGQILQPKFRMAGEPDPDGVVMRPFGGGRGNLSHAAGI